MNTNGKSGKSTRILYVGPDIGDYDLMRKVSLGVKELKDGSEIHFVFNDGHLTPDQIKDIGEFDAVLIGVNGQGPAYLDSTVKLLTNAIGDSFYVTPRFAVALNGHDPELIKTARHKGLDGVIVESGKGYEVIPPNPADKGPLSAFF